MPLAKNNSMTDWMPTKGTQFFLFYSFYAPQNYMAAERSREKNFCMNRKCSLKCNYKLIEPISEFVTFLSVFNKSTNTCSRF